ncbi:MAG: inositol monophosphatase family protein, partial [Fibrobacterota bacterium]
HPQILHLMDKTACRAAQAAAAILREHYGHVQTQDIESKGRNDFVSFVDKLAEEAIIRTIRTDYPDHTFLAEEGGGNTGPGDVRWVIDPLDGTTNYLRSHPHFSVSIAAERKGQTVYGLVLDVMTNELFTATKGGGAFCNGQRIFVSSTDILSDALVLFGTPFRDTAVLRPFALQFAEIQSRVSDHRREGSAALDFAYVAAGRAEAFWEIGLKPWDLAAGALLVKEAGGWAGDFYKDNDDIFRKTSLAVNDALTHGFRALFKGTCF